MGVRYNAKLVRVWTRNICLLYNRYNVKNNICVRYCIVHTKFNEKSVMRMTIYSGNNAIYKTGHYCGTTQYIQLSETLLWGQHNIYNWTLLWGQHNIYNCLRYYCGTTQYIQLRHYCGTTQYIQLSETLLWGRPHFMNIICTYTRDSLQNNIYIN